LLEKAAALEQRVVKTQLPVILLYSTMLLGSYCCLVRLLWAILDDFPETQMFWIIVIVSVNGAFPLCACMCVCTRVKLFPGNEQAQAPPNLQATSEPRTIGDPKLLAHLTLQTFTVETQSSETAQIGECAICLSGPYCEGEDVTELRCHHTFHSSCMAAWIFHGGRGCPLRCGPHPISTNAVEVEAAVPSISTNEVDIEAAVSLH